MLWILENIHSPLCMLKIYKLRNANLQFNVMCVLEHEQGIPEVIPMVNSSLEGQTIGMLVLSCLAFCLCVCERS